MFVYLVQDGDDKEESKRIGYIRIDTRKLLCDKQNLPNTPTWWDMHSMVNDLVVGQLLLLL